MLYYVDNPFTIKIINIFNKYIKIQVLNNNNIVTYVIIAKIIFLQCNSTHVILLFSKIKYF